MGRGTTLTLPALPEPFERNIEGNPAALIACSTCAVHLGIGSDQGRTSVLSASGTS